MPISMRPSKCATWSASGCEAGSLHGDRIFFEQFGDQRRVQISANAHDPLGLEKDDPTVTIVESHTVFRRRQGVKLHRCLLACDDEMFQVKLGSLREHLPQFGEGAGDK